jgi:hypothetical protein
MLAARKPEESKGGVSKSQNKLGFKQELHLSMEL